MTSLPSPSVKSTGFALGAHVAVLAFTESRQPWRLTSPRIWIGTLSVTTVLPSAFSVTRTLFTSPGAASTENACGGGGLGGPRPAARAPSRPPFKRDMGLLLGEGRD